MKLKDFCPTITTGPQRYDDARQRNFVLDCSLRKSAAPLSVSCQLFYGFHAAGLVWRAASGKKGGETENEFAHSRGDNAIGYSRLWAYSDRVYYRTGSIFLGS